MTDTMPADAVLLGWAEPDPKRPARLALAAAIARYFDKFGAPATVALCHPDDAAELGRDPERPPIEVRPLAHVPRRVFYLAGEEDK